MNNDRVKARRRNIRRAVGVFGFLVALLVLSPASRAMISDEELDALFQRLNDNRFDVRELAHQDFEVLLRLHQLNGPQLNDSQLRRLHSESAGLPGTLARQSLEVRKRAERLFRFWVKTFEPRFNRILREITPTLRFPEVGPDDDAVLGYHEFAGFISYPDTQGPELARLLQLAQRASNEFGAGGTADVLTTFYEVRDFLRNPANFTALRFEAHPDDVLAKLDQIIVDIETVIDRIEGETGNRNPITRRKVFLAQNDPTVENSRTFQLRLTVPPTASGMLDIVWVPVEDAVATPPPGFESLGHIFEVVAADDLLDVTGTVFVRIEYGQEQLFGNPLFDRNSIGLLRVARVANGVFQLLPDYMNDTASFVIETYYTPSPATSGLSQFGEFMVIQPARTVPAVSRGGIVVMTVVVLTGIANKFGRRRAVLEN